MRISDCSSDVCSSDLNNPGALFGEQFDAAQFLAHAYGRPVIGWPAVVRQLTLDDAMTFYRSYYAPNNAVLVVAGDVAPADLKRLAEKYYGQIGRESGRERVGQYAYSSGGVGPIKKQTEMKETE